MATHNPNIPVLGDAELIACWPQSSREASSSRGRASLDPDLMGSIDKPEVAHFVEEILEGGKAAFLMRQSKYGF
jgi:hypothetical protein